MTIVLHGAINCYELLINKRKSNYVRNFGIIAHIIAQIAMPVIANSTVAAIIKPIARTGANRLSESVRDRTQSTVKARYACVRRRPALKPRRQRPRSRTQRTVEACLYVPVLLPARPKFMNARYHEFSHADESTLKQSLIEPHDLPSCLPVKAGQAATLHLVTQ